MKKFILLISCIIICQNITIAYEYLPDKNTQNYMNPYKQELKEKIKDMPVKLKNNIQKDELPSESYAVSRMEREWFRKEFPKLNMEERVENLEEKIFGAIQSGKLNKRINNLKDAFDAQKTIQAREHSFGFNIFSGLPTSVPMNVDKLLEH